MNFIKKIFDKEIDPLVHLQFQKFSRGEFKDRAIIKAKFSAGKYTIGTSAEFANELVRIVATKLGENTTNIAGAIVSTSDLSEKINFTDKKQFQGVKRYIIDKEMTGNEIIKLLDDFPKAFFAISFNFGETILKIKPKAPKTGKPGKKGEEAPKPDFCKLVTKDKEIAENFIFEKPNFKDAEINHTFLIEKIEVPNDLKSSNDFARIREESLRIGKIIRKSKIDGAEKVLSTELRA